MSRVLADRPAKRWRHLSIAALTMAVALSGVLLAPSEARARRSVSLSASVSAKEMLVGDQVRISGRASSAVGTVVTLQRRSGRLWKTAYRARTNSSKRYLFAFDPPSGSGSYRVITTANRTYAAARTGSFSLKAYPCVPGTAPASGSTVWFSKPGTVGISSTANNLRKTICSTATGATINIAMYFMRWSSATSDGTVIIDALERMARFRGVKVNIALEGRLYRPGTDLRPTYSHLRTFANVVACSYGCHNTGPGGDVGGRPSINHNKFMTISDTRWRSGVDPVVVSSTGNWSRNQLAGAWQSTLVQYNDAALTREFVGQYHQLAVCGGSTRCTSWDTVRATLGLIDSSYAMTNVDGLWTEGTIERPGSPGRGSTVAFTPQPTSDRLAYVLERYTCAPDHRTVRTAHSFVTPNRKRVIAALVRLKDAGCDVQMLLGQPVGQAQDDAVRMIQNAGLSVRCATGIHDKLVMVDGVSPSGSSDKSLWTGAQNLGYAALRSNDEALIRLRTATATGAWVAANAAIYSSYLRYWGQQNAVAGRCQLNTAASEASAWVVGPATAELSRMASSLTSDPNDVLPPQ